MQQIYERGSVQTPLVRMRVKLGLLLLNHEKPMLVQFQLAIRTGRERALQSNDLP